MARLMPPEEFGPAGFRLSCPAWPLATRLPVHPRVVSRFQRRPDRAPARAQPQPRLVLAPPGRDPGPGRPAHPGLPGCFPAPRRGVPVPRGRRRLHGHPLASRLRRPAVQLKAMRIRFAALRAEASVKPRLDLLGQKSDESLEVGIAFRRVDRDTGRAGPGVFAGRGGDGRGRAAGRRFGEDHDVGRTAAVGGRVRPAELADRGAHLIRAFAPGDDQAIGELARERDSPRPNPADEERRRHVGGQSRATRSRWT